jgi:cbb3-type cytochrome oxidase cytochrome c subunit
MNKFMLILGITCLALAIVATYASSTFGQEEQTQTAPAAAAPGKTAFVDQKCNRCHSILSEKVELTAGGYVKSKEKNIPPDLSGVGAKHPAEWIFKYVKRTETREGVKHAGVYRGNDEQLKLLSEWLATLK